MKTPGKKFEAMTSKEKALALAKVKAAMAAKSKAKAKAAAPRRRRIRQTLDRFVVVAVNPNTTNSPKDTAGWTARLVPVGGGTAITASFDDFGLVRFPTVNTLTNNPFTLTILDENNTQLISRTVPAGREFYVARF